MNLEEYDNINVFTTGSRPDHIHVGLYLENEQGNKTFIWHVGYGALGSTVDEVKTALGRRKALINEFGDKIPMAEFWRVLEGVTEHYERTGKFR